MMQLRAAVLGAAMLSIAVPSSIGANAQTPPPKKEAELKAAGNRRLSGQEIGALSVGNTQYSFALSKAGGGNPGDVIRIFYPNARVRIVVVTGGSWGGKKVESNWWIDGNLQCAEQRIANTGHACYALYEVSSGFYACLQPAGECFYFVRFVPGNPENI